MNLAATLALYGGGPGSGCNPQAGVCGRKPGSGNYRVAATAYVNGKPTSARLDAYLAKAGVPAREFEGFVSFLDNWTGGDASSFKYSDITEKYGVSPESIEKLRAISEAWFTKNMRVPYVSRGVSGPYAKSLLAKVDEGRQSAFDVTVPAYELSSWTSDQDSAAEYSRREDYHVVLSYKATPSVVFAALNAFPPNVLKNGEPDEIIIHSPRKSITVSEIRRQS